MTKENKFKIGLCLQGIALSMDEITLKANEDRIKLIEDIIIAEPTEEKEDGQTGRSFKAIKGHKNNQ